MQRLATPATIQFAAPRHTTAHCMEERAGQFVLDLWQAPLAIGGPLPTMPLGSRNDFCAPVDLNVMYAKTCHE